MEQNMIICGPQGSGKTFLATAISNMINGTATSVVNVDGQSAMHIQFLGLPLTLIVRQIPNIERLNQIIYDDAQLPFRGPAFRLVLVCSHSIDFADIEKYKDRFNIIRLK